MQDRLGYHKSDDQAQLNETFSFSRTHETILTRAKSGGLGIVLGLLATASVLLILNAFHLLDLSRIIPQLPFLPHEEYFSHVPPIESCLVRSHDYPIVINVATIGAYVVGQYQGILQTITQDNQHHLLIGLGAKDQTYSHTFQVDALTPVYDGIHARNITFHDLKPGQTMAITFNCNSKQGDQFTIVRIGLVKSY